jgi:hypothetical protein
MSILRTMGPLGSRASSDVPSSSSEGLAISAPAESSDGGGGGGGGGGDGARHLGSFSSSAGRRAAPLAAGVSSSSGSGLLPHIGSAGGGGAGNGAGVAPGVKWWQRGDGTVRREELAAATVDDVIAVFTEYHQAVVAALADLDREEEMNEDTFSGAQDQQLFKQACSGAGGGGEAAAATVSSTEGGGTIVFWYYGSGAPPKGLDPRGARARLYAAVNRYCGAVKHLHLLRPDVVIPVLGLDLGTRAPKAGVPPGFWHRVVAALRLSTRQRQSIVAMHDVHSRNISGWAAIRGQSGGKRQGMGGAGLKHVPTAAASRHELPPGHFREPALCTDLETGPHLPLSSRPPKEPLSLPTATNPCPLRPVPRSVLAERVQLQAQLASAQQAGEGMDGRLW